MVKLHLKIGKTPVVIEADDVRDAFSECELICQLPTLCACGCDDIIPAYSKVASSGDEFFFLKCRGCGKEFKLGQRKEDKQLFPKFDDGDNGWVEPYKRQAQPRDREDRGRSYSPPAGRDQGGRSGGYGSTKRQSYHEDRMDDRRSTRHESDDF